MKFDSGGYWYYCGICGEKLPEDAVPQRPSPAEDDLPMTDFMDDEQPGRVSMDQNAPDAEATGTPNFPNLRSVIKNSEHMYEFSTELAADAVQHVMLLRNQQLEEIGKPTLPGTYLPFAQQKVVHHQLYQDWLDLPQSKSLMGRLLGRGRGSDWAKRTAKSYHNKWMKDTFGGKEWMRIIAAIGTIDRDIVDLVNEEIQRRMAKNKEFGDKPPRQLKRADRADQSFRGSGHKKTDEHMMREYARRWDKEVHDAELAWRAGTWTGTKRQWNDLLANRTYWWDLAEEISFQAGKPFDDRNRNRQLEEVTDLVGIVIREWCLRKEITYS